MYEYLYVCVYTVDCVSKCLSSLLFQWHSLTGLFTSVRVFVKESHLVTFQFMLVVTGAVAVNMP
jgi:hypothetical protein